MLFKATKDGEEVVLHRFTTGDALDHYVSSTGSNNKETEVNEYLMQWQQFHYKFVVSEEKIAGCSDFRLDASHPVTVNSVFPQIVPSIGTATNVPGSSVASI